MVRRTVVLKINSGWIHNSHIGHLTIKGTNVFFCPFLYPHTNGILSHRLTYIPFKQNKQKFQVRIFVYEILVVSPEKSKLITEIWCSNEHVRSCYLVGKRNLNKNLMCIWAGHSISWLLRAKNWLGLEILKIPLTHKNCLHCHVRYNEGG